MRLLVSIIKIGKDGKALFTPCHVPVSLEWDLEAFIKYYNCSEVSELELQVAVSSLLLMVYEMFRCPLGFQIVDGKGFGTKAQVYDFDKGFTAVDWEPQQASKDGH